MVSAENQREVSIEVATFIASLADNTADFPSGQDGLMALAIAEAAVKSVSERRAVKVFEILLC